MAYKTNVRLTEPQVEAIAQLLDDIQHQPLRTATAGMTTETWAVINRGLRTLRAERRAITAREAERAAAVRVRKPSRRR